MRLSIRVLIPVAATFVLLSIVGAGFTGALVRADAQADAAAAVQTESQHVTAMLGTAIESRKEWVAGLAQAKYQADVEGAVGDDPRVAKFVMEASVFGPVERALAQGVAADVVIVGADARDEVAFINGHRDFDADNLADRWSHPATRHYRAFPEGAPVAFLAPDERDTLLVVAAPVPTTRGTFGGYIMARAPLSGVLEAATAESHHDSAITLLDSKGNWLAGEPLVNAADFTDITAESVVRDDTIASPSHLDLGAGTLVAGSFVVVTSTPVAAMDDAIVATAAKAALPVLVVLAGVLATLFVVIHHALKPLGAMRDGVAAVGSGHFDTRVPEQGPDELRLLAVDINAMADRVSSQAHSRAATQGRLEKLATIGSLSAGIAHEVNNPLMFMQGNAELLLEQWKDRAMRNEHALDDGAFDAEVERVLKLQLQGSERIAKIVKSLDILAGTQSESRGPVPLRRVVTAAAELARIKAGDGVWIDVDVPPSVVVNGDEEALGQVFLNLITNSADAVPKHGGHVVVAAYPGREQVSVTVRDNGPGFPKADGDRAVLPFVTTKKDGTGLGLTLADHIVRDHGGSLAVGNAHGGGAEVSLELPLVPARMPPMQTDASAQAA